MCERATSLSENYGIVDKTPAKSIQKVFNLTKARFTDVTHAFIAAQNCLNLDEEKKKKKTKHPVCLTKVREKKPKFI